MPYQLVKARVAGFSDLHDHFEFDTVPVAVHKRRQRHDRLPWVSITPDHETRGRDMCGQYLAAQDRHIRSLPKPIRERR